MKVDDQTVIWWHGKFCDMPKPKWHENKRISQAASKAFTALAIASGAVAVFTTTPSLILGLATVSIISALSAYYLGKSREYLKDPEYLEEIGRSVEKEIQTIKVDDFKEQERIEQLIDYCRKNKILTENEVETILESNKHISKLSLEQFLSMSQKPVLSLLAKIGLCSKFLSYLQNKKLSSHYVLENCVESIKKIDEGDDCVKTWCRIALENQISLLKKNEIKYSQFREENHKCFQYLDRFEKSRIRPYFEEYQKSDGFEILSGENHLITTITAPQLIENK